MNLCGISSKQLASAFCQKGQRNRERSVLQILRRRYLQKKQPFCTGEFRYLQKWLVVQLTHSKRNGAKWITLVKFPTLKIRFGKWWFARMQSLFPSRLNTRQKISFFASFTGMEKSLDDQEAWQTTSPQTVSFRKKYRKRSIVRNSLRWPNYIINPLDKTKLSCKPPPSPSPTVTLGTCLFHSKKENK